MSRPSTVVFFNKPMTSTSDVSFLLKFHPTLRSRPWLRNWTTFGETSRSFLIQTRQNPRTRMQKRKLGENCNAASLSYSSHSTLSYSSYATLSYSNIDTFLKYCACHAKCKNDLPAWEFEALKKGISCETSSNFHTLKLKIDDFLRAFVKKLFYTQLIKVRFFRRFRRLSINCTKCCPCHDFWHCVMCLHSTDTAIHQSSTVATWQNAAPATRLQIKSSSTKCCACP